MPLYQYQALDGRGRRERGVTEATTAAALWQKLKERDLYPTEIKEVEKERKEGQGPSLSLFSRIGKREVTLATRNLATLLGAGLPLMPALGIIVEQTSHHPFRQLLLQVREAVREGQSLSAALSPHVKVFSPLYLYMVQAAEAAGTLPTVLDRLATFQEHQQAVLAKVKSALAYPLLMLLVGSAILFFLVVYVIPSITGIFQEMNQTLPPVTLLLISVSNFLSNFWWAVGLGGIGTVLSLRYFFQSTTRGQYLRDRIKLGLPYLGMVARQVAVARFARTLGTLLQSGVPMLTALDISQRVVNNTILAQAVRAAAQEVMQGQNLSQPLAKGGLFPPMATELIALGEHSGQLEEMLFRIADTYERETENKIMLATAMMEPLMILIMGLVVGFIVVAILLPLFEMNQLVR